MTVTPTGILSTPYLMALLLADCPKWRELTTTSTRAGALEHISIYGSDDLKNDPKPKYAIPPRAIIEDPEDYTAELVGTRTWASRGQIPVSIELEIPDSQDIATMEDERNWFANAIGQIQSEMQQLAAQGEGVTGKSHIDVRQIRSLDGPFQLSPEERQPIDVSQSCNLPVQPVWGIVLGLDFHG